MKTNGRDVEINPRTKLIEVELLELPRVCPFYPMASAGAEELSIHVIWQGVCDGLA